jgi:hypothetical protein
MGYGQVVKLPTPADVLRHSVEQIEALAQLPETILIFNRSLNTFAQTVARLDNLVRRLDQLTRPLEGPLNAIAPLVEQVNFDDLVGTFQRNVVPAMEMMGDTQAQIRTIASSIERLIAVMEESFGRVMDLPGVSLMSRLMPGGVGIRPAPDGGNTPSDG